MIEKINKDNIDELLSFLRIQPVRCIYGLSYAEGYPLDDRFYKAYKCNGGFIVVRDNIAFLYAPLNREIYEFFNFFGIDYIYSDMPLEGYNITGASVLVLSQKINREEYRMDNNVGDKEVYDLLCRAFGVMPVFENYRNTCIEQRHYLGSVGFNIRDNNKLVSTATVSMQNSFSGLISCVATLNEYRNRGLGASVVASAADSLLDAGKIPVIISEDKKVIELYMKLGFTLNQNLYISVK